MPHTLHAWKRKAKPPSFHEVMKPIRTVLPHTPPLEARGNKPLQMEFEDQLNALVWFHLNEYTSGTHLLYALEHNSFVREVIAPPKGIKKSSFSEAINSRGLEQLIYLFQELYATAAKTLPAEYSHLGELVVVDGSLLTATLSMYWADYRTNSKKARAHLGFDLNHSVPRKIFLTPGKGAERPFVSHLLACGQTGVMDRGYQCHHTFDTLQAEGKHFVCRIKATTHKTRIKANPLTPGSIVFYDAIVLLGTPGINQTQKEVRVIGYRVDNKEY